MRIRRSYETSQREKGVTSGCARLHLIGQHHRVVHPSPLASSTVSFRFTIQPRPFMREDSCSYRLYCSQYS